MVLKNRAGQRESQWKNDSTAIWNIVKIHEHQSEWENKVLEDPVAGKERIAYIIDTTNNSSS